MAFSAKEQMIGDWVNIVEDGRILKPIKVWGVSGDKSYYQPIPLTPEILTKNGFKIGYGEHRGNEGFIDDVNKHYYVKVNRWSHDKNEVGHCEVWNVCIDQHSPIYVHELQHALRLCGLWKLAENFKV